jgi:YgiT-type zinc finger domain-containing protein
MISTCYFCKGRVRKARVTIDYRWGKELFVIEDVPAGLCDQCGEKYLDSSVYKELEALVKADVRPMTRLTVDVLAYLPRGHAG